MSRLWDSFMGVAGAALAWAVIALAARAVYDEGYDAGYEAKRLEDVPKIPIAAVPDLAPEVPTA